MTDWTWKSFFELSLGELYSLLSLRAEVFVVEQNCPYQDPDGLDLDSRHLLGREEGRLTAYCRLVAPGKRFAEPSIGRVVTARTERGKGIAHEMMDLAVAECRRLYPGRAISLSAQEHLHDFYAAHGFRTEGRSYMEDGIPHLHMVREPRPGDPPS